MLAAASMPAATATSKLSDEQVKAVQEAVESKGLKTVETQPPALAADGRVDSPPGVPRDATGSHSPRLSSETVLRNESQSERDTDSLRELILRSFEAARVGGKEDWQVMSTAVLKNRFSQLLNAKFDQRQYGYAKVVDLVKDFPDLLALDESKNPPVALLLSQPAPVAVDESMQVRPDLWKAVIDYNRREPYVLVNGQAVPKSLAPEEDQQSTPLPTINPRVLDEWRADFADAGREILHGRPEELRRLTDWVESHQGTLALPGVLRGRWNLYLKNAVLERLRAWFTQQNVETPDDLVIPLARSRRPEIARQHTEESLLRAALIDSISQLSFEELRQVSLPAISLIRRRS